MPARAGCNLSGLLLATGQPTEALALGDAALTAHDKALARDHAWTRDFLEDCGFLF